MRSRIFNRYMYGSNFMALLTESVLTESVLTASVFHGLAGNLCLYLCELHVTRPQAFYAFRASKEILHLHISREK